MIHNVPIVCSRNINNRVVRCTIDAMLGVLLYHYRILCHSDRTKRRLGRTISYVVIGRTCIVYRPHKVVGTIAIEHVRSLTIGIILQCAALRCEHLECLWLNGCHILLQLGTYHIAVAPIEIGLFRAWIYKHVHVYLLTVASVRYGVDYRLAVINKRTSRTIANGNTNLLAATRLGIGTIIEIILVFALACLYLLYGWCPQIAVGPRYLTIFGIKHFALVAPLLKVGRREASVCIATPTWRTICGGIYIIAVGKVAVYYLGVGMKAGENWVLLCLGLRWAESDGSKS